MLKLRIPSKLVCFIVLCFLLKMQAKSQVDDGYAEGGLAGCIYALDRTYTAIYNPAYTKGDKSTSLGISISNPYAIPDLFRFSGGGSRMLSNQLMLSIALRGTSYEQYKNLGILTGLGIKLTPDLSIGCRLGLEQLSIQNYGVRHDLISELAVYYNPIDQLSIGLHIHNPTAKIRYEGYSQPSVINFDISLAMKDYLQFHTGIRKNLNLPFQWKFAMTFLLSRHYYLDIGLKTSPIIFEFGLVLKIRKSLSMKFHSSNHINLGWSPGLSVIYSK